MLNKTNIISRKKLAALVAAGTFALSPQFCDSAHGQDIDGQTGNGQGIGQRIGNAISGQAGPGANNTQDAVERGIQRAGQGLQQGQDIGSAAQQGLREGIQNSRGIPSQIQNRDQYGRQNLYGGTPAVGQQTFRPQYYRDANGQLFYFNNQGARVYGQNQFSTGDRWQSTSGQNYGAAGAQMRGNAQASSGQRKLGVNVTGQENGVRIDEIAENTVAAKSELQQGDVVTQIDGRSVRTVADVVNALNAPQAGADVELTVMRNGEQQNLTASFDSPSAYQSARPAMSGSGMNGTDAASLQQQIAELRREISQLRQQMQTMHPESDSSAQTSEGAAESESSTLQEEADEDAAGIGATNEDSPSGLLDGTRSSNEASGSGQPNRDIESSGSTPQGQRE